MHIYHARNSKRLRQNYRMRCESTLFHHKAGNFISTQLNHRCWRNLSGKYNLSLFYGISFFLLFCCTDKFIANGNNVYGPIFCPRRTGVFHQLDVIIKCIKNGIFNGKVFILNFLFDRRRDFGIVEGLNLGINNLFEIIILGYIF